jgi:hypothetical protein
MRSATAAFGASVAVGPQTVMGWGGPLAFLGGSSVSPITTPAMVAANATVAYGNANSRECRTSFE